MENMTKKVERMVRGSAKRKLWKRAVAIPAAVVVFITTYALILPAIAMERDTYCGYEAHQHTDECYVAQLACGYEDGATVQDVQTRRELTCTAEAHRHTEECYDENGEIICGLADYMVHTHTADCYNDAGELVCSLPEVEAHTHDESCYITETVNVCGLSESEGHTHDASCYTLVSHPELVCGMAESEGHIHSAECYTTYENTYLACGMEESEGHIHGDGCYTTVVAEDGTETVELTCGIPESLGHTHDESCYITETVTELTCGQEESAGHVHTDACYMNVETMELTCGKEESAGHTHDESCFAEQKVLICPKPEVILHTHNDDCYTVTGVAEDGAEIRELTCTQTVVTEHVHDDSCFTTYDEIVEYPHQHTDLCYIQVLACELPEHEHTDECYVKPEEPEASAEPETEYLCGMAEHTHDATCYTTFIAEDGTETVELTCGLPEHIHDETCLPVEIADEPVEIPSDEVEIVEDETPHFELPVLVCGMPEHEHSTNCMDENMVYVCGIAPHTHTGECYDIPGMDGVTPILTCTKHEHFHSEACYNEAGELTCGMEEHLHDVGCFALPENVADPDAEPGTEPVYYCGKTEHTHDETCYDEAGELVCGIEEHVHDESCLVAPVYYCGKTEHIHDETCYDEAGELTCGMEEHVHDESCLVEPTYYCGMTAHVHTEACLNEAGELICGMTEHVHDESCLIAPVYYCGMTEHLHDENCYDENGEPVCTLPEHVHSADCLIQRLVQAAAADGVMVTAEYTSEAALPEEAQLQVARFDPEANAEHYEARMNEAGEVFSAANPDQTFQPLALLKIGFYLADGTEVEPQAPVAVTVQLLDANGEAEGQPLTVVHYGENGAELVDASGEAGSEEATVAFSADAFSDFMILRDQDPSDEGSMDPLQPAEEPADGGETEGETVPPIIMGPPFDPNFLLGYSSSEEGDDDGDYGIMTIAAGSNSATNFNHNKRIDYLGDGQDNPDTDEDNKGGVTDDLYRLYLDMEGASEPVNLLIVLDRSGSMHKTGRDKTVADILFGKDEKSGLIGEFLAQNKGKTKAEKNNVAMVWYGGDLSYDFGDGIRKMAKSIKPNAASEGGESFAWKNNLGDIHYNYASMIEGGAGADGKMRTDGHADSTATNYVAGMFQAHKMLGTAPDSGTHKQVVIFLSDGVPTLYYDSDAFETWFKDKSQAITRYGGGADMMTISDTTAFAQIDYAEKPLIYNYGTNKTIYATKGDNNHGATTDFSNNTIKLGKKGEHQVVAENNTKNTKAYNVIGFGNLKSLAHSPYYKETIEIFNQFASKSRWQKISFYAVGIDMSVIECATGKQNFDAYYALDAMAGCYGGKAIRADAQKTLEKYLRQIMFPNGVTISDKLSAYVDLYRPADILVTAKNKSSGKVSELWISTKNGDGVSGENNKDAIAGNVKGSQIVTDVAYDDDTKTITVTFRDDYCLDPNYTYTLSFNVKLTQKAYDDYVGAGYKKQGDTDTDFKGWSNKNKKNNTSSLQSGFHSNEEAKVTYKVDGKSYDLSYKHPVVQAWRSQLKIKKVDADSGAAIPGVTFTLQWKAEEKDPWTNPLTRVTSSAEGADKGTADFGCLTTGYYRLVETVPEGYEGGGDQVECMTFQVCKGRIIDARLGKNVTVNDENILVHNDDQNAPRNDEEYFKANVNSKTNTTYGENKVSLTVSNTPIKKAVKIVKQDASGKELQGAKFNLYRAPKIGDVAERDYSMYNTSGVLTSDKDGVILQETQLRYGTYKLVETAARDGYEMLKEPIYFTVTKDGVNLLEPIPTIEDENGLIINAADKEGTDHITITVKNEPVLFDWGVRKVDGSPAANGLAGAEFTLYGPFNSDSEFNAERPTKEIWSFTTNDQGDPNGATQMPKLQPIKFYYLVETKAPESYSMLTEPIMLQVTVAGGKAELTATMGGKKLDVDQTTLTVTIENNVDGYVLPESGGIGTTVFYAGGMALIALAGAVFCARKRREARC